LQLPARTLPDRPSLHDALPIYARHYEIQWNNFASWLVSGGLVLAAIALVCAVVGVARRGSRTRRRVVYLLVLAAAWIVQFFNARSEEHTSELQSRENLVCRLLL